MTLHRILEIQTMNRPLQVLSGLFLLVWLSGCSAVQGFVASIGPPPAPNSQLRQSVLDRLLHAVTKNFEPLTGPYPTGLLNAHETVEMIPAQFKRRMIVKALKQPWD